MEHNYYFLNIIVEIIMCFGENNCHINKEATLSKYGIESSNKTATTFVGGSVHGSTIPWGSYMTRS
jgi:hypothetical protein